MPCSAMARLLERGRLAATEHDVEAVAERPFRYGGLEIERGDQPGPRLLVRNRVEDRIEREERVARKIHLRHQPRQEGRAEEGEVDVRRPPGIRVVSPGIGA